MEGEGESARTGQILLRVIATPSSTSIIILRPPRHPQHHHPPTVLFWVQNFASATSRTLWSRRFFGSSCRITTLCDLPWLACRTHSAQRRPRSAARRIDSRAPARNYYTPLQWRSRPRAPCSTQSRTGTMRRFVDSVVPALRR